MALSNNYKQFTDGTSDNDSSASSPAPAEKPKSVAAAIISAVATIAAAGISAYSVHRSNQANRELQNDAYDQNLLQWQRENAYNTPLAMRRRLEAAGLSAGLMYQNGVGDSASAPSPQLEASENSPLFGGLSGGMSGFANSFLENRLLEERIRGQKIANDNAETDAPVEHDIKVKTLEKINTDLKQSYHDYNRSLEQDYLDREKHDKDIELIDKKISEQETTNDILQQQLKDLQDTADSRKLSIQLDNVLKQLNINLNKAELDKVTKMFQQIQFNNFDLALDKFLFEQFIPEMRSQIEKNNIKKFLLMCIPGSNVGNRVVSYLYSNKFDKKVKSMTNEQLRKYLKDNFTKDQLIQAANNFAKNHHSVSFYHYISKNKEYQDLYWRTLNQKELPQGLPEIYNAVNNDKNGKFKYGQFEITY